MDRGSQIAPAGLSRVARRQTSRGSSLAFERHGLNMASRARAAKSGDRNTLKGITHPDKVFWPEEGYTKLDLAKFYESVFPKLKPYIADRMLSLERCPDGMSGQCFYQ